MIRNSIESKNLESKIGLNSYYQELKGSTLEGHIGCDLLGSKEGLNYRGLKVEEDGIYNTISQHLLTILKYNLSTIKSG